MRRAHGVHRCKTGAQKESTTNVRHVCWRTTVIGVHATSPKMNRRIPRKKEFKMSKHPWSRREVLRSASGALLLPILGMTSGCQKKELSCRDTAGLTREEEKARASLEYVDGTIYPAKNCFKCQLYKPGPAGQCGGCTLLKGNINHCKSWVAKNVSVRKSGRSVRITQIVRSPIAHPRGASNTHSVALSRRGMHFGCTQSH